jgi:Fe2+ transport system protein FeoA
MQAKVELAQGLEMGAQVKFLKAAKLGMDPILSRVQFLNFEIVRHP